MRTLRRYGGGSSSKKLPICQVQCFQTVVLRFFDSGFFRHDCPDSLPIPNGQDTPPLHPPHPRYRRAASNYQAHELPSTNRCALNPGLDRRPFLCSLPMVVMTDHSNSSSFGTSATVLDVAIARSHGSRVPSGHGGAVETPTQVRSGLSSCHPEFVFETPI